MKSIYCCIAPVLLSATGRRIKCVALLFLLHLSLAPEAQTVSKSNVKFISVPGGTYTVGKKDHPLNPLRKVKVGHFYIATTEVTNDQFYAFYKATGYITDAERLHNAMVPVPGLQELEWKNDSTASWRYPNGRGKENIDNKWDHPVTCISYADALVYCKWAGVRLPSLDEWEIACRAGSNADHFFGNDSSEIGQYANIGRNRDQLAPNGSNGFIDTSPVGRFKPNAWGLYDMYGNVSEFCSGRLPNDKSGDVVHARGGSWRFGRNTGNFFNSYDIVGVQLHSSFSNQGFRVVK